MNRADFCKLLKIDSTGLDNRVRHNQLPFVADERRKHGEYTPFEALTAMLVEDFVENRLDRAKAAETVAYGLQSLMFTCDRLGATSRDLLEGRRTDEIYYVVATFPFREGPTRNVYIGTFDEVTSAIKEDGEPLIDLKLVNVSRALAVMRMRAQRDGVEISPTLWEEGE